MMQSKEERVLTAARNVFVRYGFKRVTMSDLADAAQMSRPALYLLFSSKEEVFRAVMTQVFSDLLYDVREEVQKYDSVSEKLVSAFEVWCVGPFEITQTSPDAKDLLQSGYEFAAGIMQQAYADFEDVLSDVLRPTVNAQAEPPLSSEQLAHILTTAVQGFKESASSATQLRQMMKGLITVVLAGLQNQRESA